jgi:hypothetical protein
LYLHLSDERVIELAVEFIQKGAQLPAELERRIADLGLTHILGGEDEAEDSAVSA